MFFFFLELQKLQTQYDSLKIDKEDKVALYYTLKKQVGVVREKMREFVIMPIYLIPFLQVGRMVKVNMICMNRYWKYEPSL